MGANGLSSIHLHFWIGEGERDVNPMKGVNSIRGNASFLPSFLTRVLFLFDGFLRPPAHSNSETIFAVGSCIISAAPLRLSAASPLPDRPQAMTAASERWS